MDKITDLMKEEIKKIVNEENIDVNKLNEYTRIYERLKMFQVTSVQEMGMMQNRYEFIGNTAPMIGVGPRDNLGGILDIFKEAIHMQNKPHKKDEISDYIFWARFLKDIREDIREFCYSDDRDKIIEDLDKLVADVCVRVIELMRKKLEDNIAGKIDNEEIGTATIVPETIVPEAVTI